MTDTPGQQRVNSMEKNNRRGAKATGPSTRTPRKSGAKAGFASNKTSGRGRISGSSRP